MASTSSDTGSDFTRRRFIQLGGGMGLAALLAACGSSKKTAATATSAAPAPTGASASAAPATSAIAAVSSAPAKAGGSLSVVCEGGGKAELTKIAALYQQQTGTTVNLIELPYAGLYDRINSELTAGSPSFDIAALDAIWLSTFAGAVIPLDALFTADVKVDLFPSLVSESQVHGKFVGMPVWTNAEILFYRKDLFEDPKEKAAFQTKYGYALAAPTNWQQFTDAAQFFTRGTSLYGTDVKGGVETEWLATVLQAGSPGVVLDDSGNVIIDNAQHVAALQFYSDLNNKLKVDPPGAAQVDWTAAQNLFNQGKTAMTRFWAHAYPQIPKDSPVYGKVGAAPMIGGTAGIAAIPGNWYLSIPTAGKKNSQATDFVKFCYDNNALAIQSSLGLAARKSAFEQYSSKPGYEHFAALLTTLAAPATKARPATPKWQQIVDTVLVPTVQKSLTSGADYQALLTSAKKDVQRLVG